MSRVLHPTEAQTKPARSLMMLVFIVTASVIMQWSALEGHAQTPSLGMISRIEGPQMPGVKAAAEISGQWSSNIGAGYQITQTGSEFTWSAPSLNQKGTGTVQEKTLLAYIDSGEGR